MLPVFVMSVLIDSYYAFSTNFDDKEIQKYIIFSEIKIHVTKNESRYLFCQNTSFVRVEGKKYNISFKIYEP